MVFTIQDIGVIVAQLTVLLTLYVSITNRLIKLESKQEVLDNKLSYIEGTTNKERDKFDSEKTIIWRKLADIEAAHGRTNIFLEENLKTLTSIVTRQEIRTERMEEAVKQLQIDNHGK